MLIAGIFGLIQFGIKVKRLKQKAIKYKSPLFVCLLTLRIQTK